MEDSKNGIVKFSIRNELNCKLSMEGYFLSRSKKKLKRKTQRKRKRVILFHKSKL